MTLRARLILTIAGIAILLVIPAIYGVSQLRELNQIATAQRSLHGLAYEAVGGLQARLAEMDRVSRAYLVDGDAASRAAMFRALDSARIRLVQLDTANYDVVAASTRVRIDSIGRALFAVDSLMQLAVAEPVSGAAQSIKEQASDAFEGVKPLFDETKASVNAIGVEIDRRSSEDLAEAGQISENAFTTTALALLICLSIAVALGAWTTRALTRPVMQLRHAMALVADGIFRVPEHLPYERQDEIGSVSRSFRAMTHRLSDLDRLKAEFMSISTHELKTPINVISGYAELMYERVYGDLSDKQEEALTAIRDQTRVMTQLVNQLLDVSRLEAGGMRVHFRPVSVRDLFHRVERSFDGLAQKKQIALTVEVDASAPETIDADGERISDQVLGNLLSNALKFTPEGGRIDVRAWLEGGALQIQVEDTGPGIAADKLPFIFDKFYQVGAQARAKGAGLGLAIAHEVVEAHGGSIRAASEPGKGTCFHIDLPVHQTDLEEPTPAETVAAGEPG